MLVTLYKRPNGHHEDIDIGNIADDDAEWFEANNVRISMEDCGIDTAVYADCGFHINDDPNEDPDEIIVFAKGRTCEETMTALRAECVAMMAEKKTLSTPGSEAP